MDQESTIQKTVEFVKSTLAGAEGGHDWWHIFRVWNLSKQIVKTENANPFVVELGALLHDIADAKFHYGDESLGPEKAVKFLSGIGVSASEISQVEYIVANISYKGGHNDDMTKTPELMVVQDADRLDALGAVGIARTFNYGGFKNREIFNPEILPCLAQTKEEYKKSNAPTINHFYEKLLLLRDKMNTASGKKMANHRHQFMEEFLEEFYREWDGEE